MAAASTQTGKVAACYLYGCNRDDDHDDSGRVAVGDCFCANAGLWHLGGGGLLLSRCLHDSGFRGRGRTPRAAAVGWDDGGKWVFDVWFDDSDADGHFAPHTKGAA